MSLYVPFPYIPQNLCTYMSLMSLYLSYFHESHIPKSLWPYVLCFLCLLTCALMLLYTYEPMNLCPYISILLLVYFSVFSKLMFQLFCDCYKRAYSLYPSLCRGLEYLLKSYFIPNYPNVAGFLIFKTVFWVGRQHCPMSENNTTKMNGICIW